MVTALYGQPVTDIKGSAELAELLNHWGFKPAENSFPNQTADFWFGLDDEGDYRIAIDNGSGNWVQVYYDEFVWMSLLSDFNPAKPTFNYDPSDWKRLDTVTEPTESSRRLRTLDDMIDDRTVLVDDGMAKFAGGGIRSSDESKPDFTLLMVTDLAYGEQVITRAAQRMQDGAQMYGRLNHEKMNDPEALARCKASLLRHTIQYLAGEIDEDHAAGVLCNLVMLSGIEGRVR